MLYGNKGPSASEDVDEKINPYNKPNILSQKLPKLDFWKSLLIKLLIFLKIINDNKKINGIDKTLEIIFNEVLVQNMNILFFDHHSKK